MASLEDYTRVTTVLSEFAGLHKIPTDVLANAAARGSRVHIACDCIINGVGYDEEEDTKGYIDSFLKWKGEKRFLPHPGRFFDDELMITGECDALYTHADGLILVDFKTSYSKGKTWEAQGSAYSHMAKLKGLDILGIEFVHLKKDGREPAIYQVEEDFDHFLNLYEIWTKYFKTKKTNEELIYEYL